MIKKLSQETINLISAGEVIEGPCDILKELIENSIDAEAKSITIKLKNSGIDLIEITDDGKGISKEDLEICTQRHTTSKLEKIDDLYSLDTFGFRGEALSSISAVTKLEIISANNDDGQGHIFKEEKIGICSSSRGTTITTKDLFYNVPVRRKFLKSKAAEFTRAYNTILDFIIQYPQIRFHFISDKKEEVFPATTQANRYVQVFGKDILSKVYIINHKSKLFKISGIIAKPNSHFFFPTNFIYINKRPVISTQINKLILGCYKDYLMVQQKPFFVLFIELNPKTVDINIHPKKRFIKIQNEFLFNAELKEVIENVLFKDPKKEETNTHYFLDTQAVSDASNNIMKASHTLADIAPENYNYKNTYFSNKQGPLNKIVLNGLEIKEIVGQIFDTFIVCRTSEGLLLIDQHAAEERINLEKNRQAYSADFKTQTLMIPKRLDFLSEMQREFVQVNKKLLADLGFTIKLDKDDLYLNTIPEFLERYFDHTFFLDLLNDIEDTNNFNIVNIKDKILKLKSCKESIKANDPLSISQMYSLIENLDKCKDKEICAHGRPTFILLNKKELEKMFKRII